MNDSLSKDEQLKTGTTTVCIVCKDGIIMAADKRVTAGHMIVNKKFEKVHLINDKIALTMAGLVSDAQLLTKLIRAEIKLKSLRTNRESTVREAANLLAGMNYNNIRVPSMVPGIVAFLFAGYDKDGFNAFNIGIDGSITKIEEFESDGSGSVFALGVLETLYEKDMSIEEGMKLATKAINAALQRDCASGDGIDIVTITKEGAKKVLTKHLEAKLI